MPELSPVSYKKFIRRLKKFNFTCPYEGGKHLYMLKNDIRLTIPNPHKRKEIGIDLLSRILKQAKIFRNDWIS